MLVTSYCSVIFLGIFLPVSVFLYIIAPKKARPYILLVESYALFALMSGLLIIYPAVTALTVYGAGIWLSSVQRKRNALLRECEKERKKAIRAQYIKKQRMIVALALVLNIGALVLLKYTKFLTANANDVLSLLNSSFVFKIPKFAAPMGISFYTLMAASYVLDVYHEKISADRNFWRVALYLSFFPQIMEGPICRYSDTAAQLWSGERIRFKNLTFGLQRVAFGVMKMMVIADRLNSFVETVYTGFSDFDGGITALAAILYTCQLYMEFSGTMDIVIGCGEIFGVTITENFRRPFFSKTISEFWQRWHITLGTWFKDYIYYPVSMSKPMKRLTSNMRKKLGVYYGPMLASTIALFCVWLCNGLWHGAGWRFIFFGMYHFVLITCGNLIAQPAMKLNKKLGINNASKPYRAMQILRTTLLVCIGEMFFRADGLRAGFVMFGKIFTDFSLKSFGNGIVLKLGMDGLDFIVIGVAVLIVFVISILNERGVSVREELSKKHLIIRWLIIYALIMFIVIFGAYGPGYDPVPPIYADF